MDGACPNQTHSKGGVTDACTKATYTNKTQTRSPRLNSGKKYHVLQVGTAIKTRPQSNRFIIRVGSRNTPRAPIYKPQDPAGAAGGGGGVDSIQIEEQGDALSFFLFLLLEV